MDNFNLPVGADPTRDIPWGTDELGFPQFRTASGTIYSRRQQVVPERESQPGTMDRAIEVAKGYATDALQGLLGAATAPRRALEGGDGVTPADALNLAGLLQLGGAASMGRGVMDYDPTTMRSFSDYLSTVNPRNIRVDANDRPNLMMGDMYGMLPRGSRKISQKDGVTFHRGPDGDYYATAYNPDVGEQDVVGYIMPRGDMTELAVVNEMQGKGIGSQLQYLLRRENPNAPTGGLTEGGEAALRKTYDRLVGEGILSANRDATAAAIALPVARNESEAMARKILEMRAAGRAGEVTEEMMAAADPQYMYRNTPLPMDEASRMARAQEMGFDTGAYHATKSNENFSTFMPSWRGTNYFAIGPDEAVRGANAGAADVGSRGSVEAVMPVNMRSSEISGLTMGKTVSDFYNTLPNRIVGEDALDEAIADMPSGYGLNWDVFYRENRLPNGNYEYIKQPVKQTFLEAQKGYDLNRSRFGGWNDGSDVRSLKRAQKEGQQGFLVTDEAGVSAAMGPEANIRSRFARFDPEFSHLANLSAANVSPEVGLLAQQSTDADKEAILRYLGAQGLLR